MMFICKVTETSDFEINFSKRNCVLKNNCFSVKIFQIFVGLKIFQFVPLGDKKY